MLDVGNPPHLTCHGSHHRNHIGSKGLCIDHFDTQMMMAHMCGLHTVLYFHLIHLHSRYPCHMYSDSRCIVHCYRQIDLPYNCVHWEHTSYHHSQCAGSLFQDKSTQLHPVKPCDRCVNIHHCYYHMDLHLQK